MGWKTVSTPIGRSGSSSCSWSSRRIAEARASGFAPESRAIRSAAYTADRLDAQLDDALRRFLSDRSRNRYDAGSGTLRVSRIFDWYRKDFEQGHQGYASLEAVFARHADRLADRGDARARIRAGDYRLDFLPYDWALNDAR